MEIKEVKAIIEAVLFAAGDPVPLEKLSDITECDKNTLRSVIQNMMYEWDREVRGIQIREVEGSYFMCTRPLYYEYAGKLFESRQKQGLSQASMEVLAIVAYNQPVTRADIEKVRGVSCDYAISKLQERNLIFEAGRMDAPGKPILFETTEEFLKSFGFRSLDDLPDAQIMDIGNETNYADNETNSTDKEINEAKNETNE